MKRYIYTLFLVLLSGAAVAQQDPQFSMYMFNGLVINPAYAGSRDQLSMVGIFRKQWAGMNGAPSTQSFSAHAPSRNLRHGFGISLINDHIGVTNALNVNLIYAYRIPVSDNSNFAFGLQGNVLNYSTDFSSLALEDESDIAFAGNDINKIFPNAGAGVYFNSEKVFLGASVPRIIRHKLVQNNTALEAQQAFHVLGNGGVIIPISDGVKFKPSFLVKYTPGAPVVGDINASFLFAEKFWVGASYRTQDALAFLFEFWPTKGLRLGYAYDYTLSDLADYNSGSHEFMIGFDFSFDKDKVVSPRYF